MPSLKNPSFKVNSNLITFWKDDKQILVKEPFANVVRELERWYHVKIEIQGNRLKNLVIPEHPRGRPLGRFMSYSKPPLPSNINTTNIPGY